MKNKIRIPKRGWAAIHLALLAWIAWILAGMVAGYFGEKMAEATYRSDTPVKTSRAPMVKPIKDYSLILKGNIFNPAQREVEEYSKTGDVEVSSTGEYKDATKTSLPLTLVGTVIAPERRLNLAAIQVKDEKEDRVLGENDKILEATITKIERNRIFLSRNGKTEFLAIDFEKWKNEVRVASARDPLRGPNLAGDIAETGDGQYAISRRYLDAQLANMSQLITEVRAVPNIGKDGAADGFKLFSVKKGSIFDRIGFKNRDVLKRVNGVNIDSAEKGLELFQALRNETDFNVDIERNNNKKSLQFSVQ